ncbi:NVEALA domain-containing protein [Sphingobacterium sp. UT-1RO-CII-1]|uniref:NVEALA domain-containing protein n=1 Tax=Sphingobacterium sp. UT-1RO-CII-1 TaxID=2995225 RepID=UPI00227D1D8D|nr:NVEALA domain-containing protein [Sphingobacterium sp. UT-1RO-CII-1]MCY4778296.1 NVEALA domain-containing protein [Sphingobacterium sp. UT-1RO-CII-1]
MKKKILGALAVVAIAAVATFNMNINNNDELSAISLANVEALAMNESGGSGNCQKNCKLKLHYLCITTNGDNKGYICADN